MNVTTQTKEWNYFNFKAQGCPVTWQCQWPLWTWEKHETCSNVIVQLLSYLYVTYHHHERWGRDSRREARKRRQRWASPPLEVGLPAACCWRKLLTSCSSCQSSPVREAACVPRVRNESAMAAVAHKSPTSFFLSSPFLSILHCSLNPSLKGLTDALLRHWCSSSFFSDPPHAHTAPLSLSRTTTQPRTMITKISTS